MLFTCIQGKNNGRTLLSAMDLEGPQVCQALSQILRHDCHMKPARGKLQPQPLLKAETMELEIGNMNGNKAVKPDLPGRQSLHPLLLDSPKPYTDKLLGLLPSK